MIFTIKKAIINFLKQEILIQNDFKFTIEIPANDKFGDLSTNVLMIYRKQISDFETFKTKLIIILQSLTHIDKVEYFAPGFLNIHINPDALLHLDNFWLLIQNHENKGKNISIEYASPNPTGPCHIGHARGAIIGDIIANVFLYLGYNGRKDCLFNDFGKQVDYFIESVYIRYEELQGKIDQLNKLFYKGGYVINIAKKYSHQILNKEEFLQKKIEILEMMKEDMQEVLSLLKIKHDVITYESKLFKEKEICWNILKEKNLLEYEKTEQGTKILFASKQFDDDKDRVIEREDGTATYFGNDIAYHWKKKNYLHNNQPFTEQIVILGDDHIGYLKRLAGAVHNLDINLHIITHNLVKIFKNQMEIKMSKRQGQFITIRDFLDKYGNQDLLRILLIEHSYSSLIYLDLDKISLEDSALFYIQYAYARLWSILNKTTYENNYLDFNLLQISEEKKLITLLIYWPEFIHNVSQNLEVHLILMYAKNFAKILHTYLTKYTILQDNIKLQNTRIFLLKNSLMLLNDLMDIMKIEKLKTM